MSLAVNLTEQHARALLKDDYFVVDGLFGRERALGFHREAYEASRQGILPEHHFQFGKACFRKPHIFEADLFDTSFHEVLPSLAKIYTDDSLTDALSSVLPELDLRPGTAGRSVKLQHNAGYGGCFPLHYDNAGRPSNRALTCVVYLNADWQEGDGGEIVLIPFLRAEIIIPPLLDRAVFFRSDRILHRVRPSLAERFCFTIWFDSPSVNRDEDCNLKEKHLNLEPGAVELLRMTPLQRAVSRAVYAEDYEAGLLACMIGEPGLESMLAEHRAHVASAMSHPKLGPFVDYLRGLRVAGDTNSAGLDAGSASQKPACNEG